MPVILRLPAGISTLFFNRLAHGADALLAGRVVDGLWCGRLGVEIEPFGRLTPEGDSPAYQAARVVVVDAVGCLHGFLFLSHSVHQTKPF